MRLLSFIFVLLLIATSVGAQSTGELQQYRRSALAEMMVYHSEDEFGAQIYEAFSTKPPADKYDNHNFGFDVIDNDSIPNVKKKGHGLIKAQIGKNLNSSDVKKNGEMLCKMLNQAEIAKIMVAKWFGMTFDENFDINTATFNVDLIQQRGLYNASELDVALAEHTARGIAQLEDAGEELISNTFLLVSDITYVTAEEKAAIAKTVMNVVGGVLDAFLGDNSGTKMAQLGGEIADSFTGFTVKTNSYLFRLDWNDSIAAIFYNNYYTSTPNPEKINAFIDDLTTFRLKFVAHEYEYDDKSVIVGEYDRKELIKMVCARSVDKNIAALQLAYEDFKVKTPVYAVVTDDKGKVVGYSAKIGMKEGITENSKFQVIERYIDPKTNKTRYRYIASLKPIKGQVWDNRYNAVTEKSTGSTLTATTFKKTGGGEILPGMLIIEGKYKKVEGTP